MILEDGMLLYHGSYAPINAINLEMCSEGKDFGKGFYLTDGLEQARNFIKNSLLKAKNVKKIPVSQNFGYVTTFRFKKTAKEIPTYTFKTADKEWLWFVSMNRRAEMVEVLRQDLRSELLSSEIIIGKIANDTTNPTIMAYLDGLYGDLKSKAAIDFAINQLMPNKLKNQCCFLTERAISCLEFVEVKKYER